MFSMNKNLILLVAGVALFALLAVGVSAKPLDVYDELMGDNDNVLSRMMDLIDSIGSDDSEDDSGRLASDDSQESVKQLKASERCALPIRRGVCRALIPRWSYDPTTKDCKEFKFGGCDGNSNNFGNYKQCMEICRGI